MPARGRCFLSAAAVLLLAGLRLGAGDAAPNDPVCQLPDGRRVHAGTLRMATLLAKVNAETHPALAFFQSRERVPLARRQLEASRTNYFSGLVAHHQLATELLNAGDTIAAIAEFGHVYTNALHFNSVSPGSIEPKALSEIRLARAVAQLRLGEQENCLDLHNADSCLFPLPSAAQHTRPAGSAAALGTLGEMLQEDPGNLYARWLYNVAAMTLGRYPDGVPAAWLVPPAVFASEQSFPRFPDASIGLGLDLEGLAGGVAADDFDNDGDLDLFVSDWEPRGQLRYFRSNGDGSYTERTREAALSGLVGGLNIMQTDFDNDGWLDLFVIRGAWAGRAGLYPDSLIRNRGDGTFEDVTEAAGMLSYHPSQTAVWADFDVDGRVDVFIGNETTEEGWSHPCQLFLNNGDGTFTDIAAAAGVAVRDFVKGVTAGDYDDDGRPDLYVSVRAGKNLLFRNLGPRGGGPGLRFEEVGARAGVSEPVFSFPTWFFDYDNDGRQDLFVSGYFQRNAGEMLADLLGKTSGAERARLYRNRGDGTFEDVTRPAGLHRVLLTMGSNFGDLDADGYPDIYLGTGDPDFGTIIPNRLFRNDGGRRFLDVTTAAGMGHLQKGHAIAFADLDEDGDVDVYADMGGAYPADRARNALFENPGSTNRLVKLRLIGTKSNRAAIGARIELTLQTPAGERRVYRWVNSGGSFGANPLRQEIGVADATQVAASIRWPSGAEQKFSGLEPGGAYSIREGNASAEPLVLKPASFARKAPAPHHEHHATPAPADRARGPDGAAE
ncbi:MAG: CRTAC1 family protein [Limisphaerales bacterium]